MNSVPILVYVPFASGVLQPVILIDLTLLISTSLLDFLFVPLVVSDDDDSAALFFATYTIHLFLVAADIDKLVLFFSHFE